MVESTAGVDQKFASAVLAALPDPVIVMDATGNVMHANAAAERVLGWPAEDRVGTSVMDLVHPADRQLTALSLTSMGAKEIGTAIEVRVATRDGGWRHLEVIGTNLLADPAVSAIVVVARDLTERRRWEIAGGDETRFRLVVQHSAVITMLLDSDGLIASASAALTRLLGHDPERVAGQHLRRLVAEPDRDRIAQALGRAASATEPTTLEASFPRPFGDGAVDLELTIVNLVDDPVVGGFIVTGHDIGDRKAAEAAVLESQRQLTEAQRLARLGSWRWDIASGAVTWSPQLIEMFDLDEDTYPRDYDAYLDAIHPDDRVVVDVTVRRSLESGEPFEVDHRVDTRHGIRWLHGRGSVVLDGHIAVGMIGTCIDVTERLQLQEELQALSLIDPLTGLRNRRGFLITAEQELRLARRLDLSAALIYADLDNLKDINDTYGHPEGDRALREVADVISTIFRESDIKARLGGDEYAVFLIDADPGSNAERAVVRVRAALDQRNRSHSYPYELSLSIGVVVTDGTATLEAMLTDADGAMYADKHSDKRRPRLLVVEDDASLRRLLEEHLRATYDVTAASDLGQAIDALSAGPADIVLLDRNLPDSQGADTLAQLRDVAGGARLVVMTGDGNEPEADTLRSGAADYITKPFDLNVLDARLGRLAIRSSRHAR